MTAQRQTTQPQHLTSKPELRPHTHTHTHVTHLTCASSWNRSWTCVFVLASVTSSFNSPVPSPSLSPLCTVQPAGRVPISPHRCEQPASRSGFPVWFLPKVTHISHTVTKETAEEIESINQVPAWVCPVQEVDLSLPWNWSSLCRFNRNRCSRMCAAEHTSTKGRWEHTDRNQTPNRGKLYCLAINLDYLAVLTGFRISVNT